MSAWMLLLPLTALWTLVSGPRWVVMICIALSMLQILKLTVLLQFQRAANRRMTPVEIAVWCWAWPGLNAPDFFSSVAENPTPVRGSEWLAAVVKLLLGVAVLMSLVPVIATCNRLASGWVAMFGLLMVFHFGAFHLLALTWHSLGRSVQPIMYRPLLATSVGDFWSHRWNLAFRDFANQFVMRPLARRWSGIIALWGCFLFSGLVHELAISVPAQGGYGWPTAYFLLQAAGATFERTRWADRIGLRRGLRGWLFALLTIGPAAFMLFHPKFLLKVVLPLIGMTDAVL